MIGKMAVLPKIRPKFTPWVLTCKMIISLVFFIFFFNFDFLGGKRAKNSQKFYLLHSTFQEPYIIWFFVVHKSKKIMSQVNLFVLSKFWFFGLLGGSKGKKWPKMTQNSALCTLYVRNHTSYDLHLWYTCSTG